MVLITGATGLVGEALLEELRRVGTPVVCAVRDPSRAAGVSPGLAKTRFDLERPEELDAAALQGVDCVYHLAARVHVMRDEDDSDRKFHALNVHATEVLARAAAAAGVRRFVYVSSIKVNGERTVASPFHADDAPSPQDAYARSKLAAELALQEIARSTGMSIAIVRPPLVYGPAVRANFRKMMSLVARGFPLPLASICNHRSLVSVWNLASLLRRVGEHAAAANRIWLVSDGEDVSTPQLLRILGTAMGRRTRLWSVPVPLLRMAGAGLGQSRQISRLVDSLQIDMSATCSQLEWRPPVTFEEGIARTTRPLAELAHVRG